MLPHGWCEGYSVSNGNLNRNTPVHIEKLKRHYDLQHQLLERALKYVEAECYAGCSRQGCVVCGQANALGHAIRQELDRAERLRDH